MSSPFEGYNIPNIPFIPLFPRNAEDVTHARLYIQRAASNGLPAELLKRILYLADYDCVHFFVYRSGIIRTNPDDQQSEEEAAYAETPPLNFLRPPPPSPPSRSTSEAGSSQQQLLDDNLEARGRMRGGRIRVIRLLASVGDEDTERNVWSWVEVARRPTTADGKPGEREVRRQRVAGLRMGRLLDKIESMRERGGPLYHRGGVAAPSFDDWGTHWEDDGECWGMQKHCWKIVGKVEEGPERHDGGIWGIRKWAEGLRNGDRVSILPLANGGWKRDVRAVWLDIEVEIW